jgi:hypothetical protein
MTVRAIDSYKGVSDVGAYFDSVAGRIRPKRNLTLT